MYVPSVEAISLSSLITSFVVLFQVINTLYEIVIKKMFVLSKLNDLTKVFFEKVLMFDESLSNQIYLIDLKLKTNKP